MMSAEPAIALAPPPELDSAGVAALLGSLPDGGPHAERRLIETHISWILLAGEFAWKLRKPVTLPFLDFSTLEARRADCLRELELNRRWAPELYLDVVPVRGPVQRPSLDGDTEVVDYAVKMRRFPDDARLDRVAERGGLDGALVDRIAAAVAALHADAPRATPRDGHGTPGRIEHEVRGNFEALEDFRGFVDTAALRRLRLECEERLRRLRPVFVARLADGFVRECHGDLHLENLALVGGEVLPFDGVEFEPAFRWVDVASDLAFALMDLHARGHTPLACRLLNRYLDLTGDHGLLRVLRHYLAYRALVRAKVAAIRCAQGGPSAAEHRRRANTQVSLAAGFHRPPGPCPLVITHGASGSGKSWLSSRLAPLLGAVWLRSDVERARLFPDDAARYGAAATEATYRHLAALTELALSCGFPVLVDATFQDPGQRRRFARVAASRGTTLRILDLTAPRPVLEQRVRERAACGNDPSQADTAVLAAQLDAARSLEPAERASSLTLDTAATLDLDAIRAWINPLAEGTHA